VVVRQRQANRERGNPQRAHVAGRPARLERDDPIDRDREEHRLERIDLGTHRLEPPGVRERDQPRRSERDRDRQPVVADVHGAHRGLDRREHEHRRDRRTERLGERDPEREGPYRHQGERVAEERRERMPGRVRDVELHRGLDELSGVEPVRVRRRGGEIRRERDAAGERAPDQHRRRIARVLRDQRHRGAA
jgi:hypothetical protein